MKVTVERDGQRIDFDDGLLARHEGELESLGEAPLVRRAYAAAHVVMKPSYATVDHAPDRAGSPEEIDTHVDLSATMALRRRLDGLGLGVAEAMDTAQRFEIGWVGAKRLIEETGRLGLSQPFIAGVSTDHLDDVRSTSELVDGVRHQIRFVRKHGGEPIILPMAWLTTRGLGEEAYVEVYGEIVRGADGPVWIHWLGEMFLPALAGYFPGRSFERVMALDRGRVKGVKISLLDALREIAIRRALAPHGQTVFTGDDFHFADLIAGDEHGFSHALLGVFDATARPASLALRFLAHGRRDRFLEIMRPCEALGRHVFAEPTMHYKAGLAFLAWLNGLQDNPMLPNRVDRARDLGHLLRCAELAAAAGAIENAELAAGRLRSLAR